MYICIHTNQNKKHGTRFLTRTISSFLSTSLCTLIWKNMMLLSINNSCMWYRTNNDLLLRFNFFSFKKQKSVIEIWIWRLGCFLIEAFLWFSSVIHPSFSRYKGNEKYPVEYARTNLYKLKHIRSLFMHQKFFFSLLSELICFIFVIHTLLQQDMINKNLFNFYIHWSEKSCIENSLYLHVSFILY